ncbi:storkhead-box protein 1-like isoform X2 [Mya arenaria]|uniref:storkhead-box protein 1-like isoform X2 n=1 Tax=Mya arenaria TaxID=6604 RepID=UPI0022DF9407|nr:storkhead-box protein 1-like isoform X2 [Mya arenaria]
MSRKELPTLWNFLPLKSDVQGIEMQVIPQTQFIPLPEALCLLILDLNNSQIVATLDTVTERLRQRYQGMNLPSNQLMYDTLGQLIRERKVFHTGCGYFVVTPDTFRMHGDDMQFGQMMSQWTHLHPMYIPSAFSQPARQPMRSISCQVDSEENVIGQSDSCDLPEKRASVCNEKLQVDIPTVRVQRSMSVSVKRSRERGKRDDGSEAGTLKRSSSMKGRNEKQRKQETKSEQKQEKGKVKTSFFSKIFGRNKKKPSQEEPVKPTKPVVEYATFSAQFPPPEWMWYQQQQDRQMRTETWVHQQMAKCGTWHYLQRFSQQSPSDSVKLGPSSLPEPVEKPQPKGSSLQGTAHTTGGVINGTGKKSKGKSHKKDRLPVVIANIPGESTRIDFEQKNTYTNSMGQTNIKLSSLPTRLSPSGEVVHSNYVSHPMFSSTPRFSSVREQYKKESEDEENRHEGKVEKPEKSEKSKSSRKPHRSKKKSHHDRHSSYYPSSRHVSGLSQPLSPVRDEDNDISFEYQGKIPNKNSSFVKSHSSGVNCIGLEADNKTQVKLSYRSPMDALQPNGQKYQRSSSYRHPVSDPQRPSLRSNSYRHVVKDRSDQGHSESLGQGHIYANVHITEDARPALPERSNRRLSSQDCEGHMNPGQCYRAMSPAQSPNYLDLPESDRRSEPGSDRGTLTSTSSRGQSSHDSAIDQSSEHSMGTVIHTRPVLSHQLERLVADTKELVLGDSGFSSPRPTDNGKDTSKGEGSLKDQTDFMCNNLRTDVRGNHSSGKGGEFSDDSFDRISSDKLYENVRISHKEMLNNMKYLHKEINVSSQNLNVPNTTADSSSSHTDYDPKQAVAKKFNFEGDFHVVGVV